MRIRCPYCGERSSQEYDCRGAAVSLDISDADPLETLYLRDNPAGPLDEHFYHRAGCRQWLVVTCDTRTHEIVVIRLASEPRP